MSKLKVLHVKGIITLRYTPSKRQEKREEIWLSPMAKAPTPIENSNKQRDNRKNVT